MKRPIAYFAGTGRGVPATVMTNYRLRGDRHRDDRRVDRRAHGHQAAAHREDRSGDRSRGAGGACRRWSAPACTPGELDVIVLGTASPDRLLPSAAVDLQAALGASRAAAFDIGAACSGFIYGATVAEGMIATGNADTALVVGVEKLSRSSTGRIARRACCSATARAPRCSSGSQAAANRGISRRFMRSDGTLGDLLCRPGGGAAIPFSRRRCSPTARSSSRWTAARCSRTPCDRCPKPPTRALDAAKLTGDDIDLMIPHQANIRIIEATAKHANIPMDKVYVNVDRFGNTSAASVPIALDEAIESGRVGEGSTVLLVAFGAGFTWGSMVVRL